MSIGMVIGVSAFFVMVGIAVVAAVIAAVSTVSGYRNSDSDEE